ncbi:MAG: HEAT repeat domain-containing protein, partial [Planctomycetes bacterium]|nr:HEAT repeat domain-containing protein [Planctomycetota bacterium]
GNRGDPAALTALAAAITDPDAIVRGHAAWAIGRIDHRHPSLANAARIETDERVRRELEAALAGRDGSGSARDP